MRLLLLYIPVLLTGCASLEPFSIPPREPAGRTVVFSSSERNAQLSETQVRLLSGAEEVLGARRLVYNGRSYPLDCTGVVQAIYARAGIDLQTPLNSYRGNGVARLNAYLQDQGFLYSTALPAPGDLIFWDNTYDRNGDGLWNDLLTHVGMVVAVDEAGNIDYIHHNYRRGIVLARMNLLKPDTVAEGDIRVNSAMRMRDGQVHPLWLSSHLYRELGRGYLLEREG